MGCWSLQGIACNSYKKLPVSFTNKVGARCIYLSDYCSANADFSVWNRYALLPGDAALARKP
jgi:hypothetical protein